MITWPFACLTTSKCELLQTFQNNFLKIKNIMIRNNCDEPNNITLVGWVNKAFDETKHQTWG
jgi:hypothetical protein